MQRNSTILVENVSATCLPSFSPHPSCFSFAPKLHPAPSHTATATFKKRDCSVPALVSCSQSRRWDPLMMIPSHSLYEGSASVSVGRERCLTEPGIPRGAEMLALIPPSPPFWELLHSSSGGSQSLDGLLEQVPDLSTRHGQGLPLPRAS